MKEKHKTISLHCNFLKKFLEKMLIFGFKTLTRRIISYTYRVTDKGLTSEVTLQSLFSFILNS